MTTKRETFADELRKKQIGADVLWQMKGPKDTGIARITCYAIHEGYGARLYLEMTYSDGHFEVMVQR